MANRCCAIIVCHEQYHLAVDGYVEQLSKIGKNLQRNFDFKIIVEAIKTNVADTIADNRMYD